MSNETIMLAKTYSKPSQLLFPIVATEKLDGVAADFFTHHLGMGAKARTMVRTRQDEPIYSVTHIQEWLKDKLPVNHHVICELYIKGMAFKDISGLVRTEDEQAPELKAYIYDYYVEGKENSNYFTRMSYVAENIAPYITKDSPVQIIPGKKLLSVPDFEDYVASFARSNPKAEGLVVRSLYDKSEYKSGWRSPGMLKVKTTNTIDLEVESFEEAKDAKKKPKGMVGRINVWYKKPGMKPTETNAFTLIGVGPGKLTHAERKEIWENQEKYFNKIAEVTYMPDDSYDALREPRFIRWRFDKSQPSQE